MDELNDHISDSSHFSRDTEKTPKLEGELNIIKNIFDDLVINTEINACYTW